MTFLPQISGKRSIIRFKRKAISSNFIVTEVVKKQPRTALKAFCVYWWRQHVRVTRRKNMFWNLQIDQLLRKSCFKTLWDDFRMLTTGTLQLIIFTFVRTLASKPFAATSRQSMRAHIFGQYGKCTDTSARFSLHFVNAWLSRLSMPVRTPMTNLKNKFWVKVRKKKQNSSRLYFKNWRKNLTNEHQKKGSSFSFSLERLHFFLIMKGRTQRLVVLFVRFFFYFPCNL